jgi:hypothetical protein
METAMSVVNRAKIPIPFTDTMLENLTPSLPQEYCDESGQTTAHLKKGEDCLRVVDKMLREKGFVDWEAVPATDMVLQVDLDMPWREAKLVLDPIIPMLKQRIGLGLKWAHYPSKSGEHTHAVFMLPEPMELYERMAWQAALGSDRKREALNLIGLHNGVLNQVVLFTPKDTSGIIYESLDAADAPRRIKSEAD